MTATSIAAAERPSFVEDEHLEYLDELRESGIVNMGGAGQFIQSEFSFDARDARTILKYWMATFSERHAGGVRP